MIEGEMNSQNFYTNLLAATEVYEGCGNILGIVPLDAVGYSGDFQSDATLRQFLKGWGKAIRSDSVMVLSGNPDLVDSQGYHYRMAVFEPNSPDMDNLPGGISAMCGNGVRAVAAYIREQQPDISEARIMTESGLLTVDFDGNSYEVNMGVLTSKASDLKLYVNPDLVANNQGEYSQSPIPEAILEKISSLTSVRTWSIGLTGNRNQSGEIDGEPHVIMQFPENEVSDIRSLRELVVKLGSLVTRNLELFPQEINLNLIVLKRSDFGAAEMLNCTHERNLGNDPEKSVTQACGTGSTVAGGIVMRQTPTIERVLVHCLGGDLQISRKEHQDSLYMKGPVSKINSALDESIISGLINE